jgi:cytochrome c oxidase accessory protein FixG
MIPKVPRIFKDRLSTTDEFGARVRVIPAPVRGIFHKWRVFVQSLLLLFFLFLPWITIDGLPFFRIDLADRRFYFLGHVFFAQDTPHMFFIIATFATALLFFSAVLGRVWCGWACPQTVFIEAFFRRVERWIEGDHLKQRALDKAAWSVEKIWKKSAKWFVFTLGALFVTHTALALFLGPEKIFEIVVKAPAENWGAFLFILISTGVFLFDFGWFREQFCLVACPYGRFQSVMLDEDSLTVAYGVKRGEPRKSGGDCINCFKCVNVCPTGIDIRNGFQMECIACTACIDACDEVMVKIGKPKGLIRYASERSMTTGATKKNKLARWLRPRTAVYGGLLVLFLSILIVRVFNEPLVQIEAVRAAETPYQLISEMGVDGQNQEMIINHFKIYMYNRTVDKIVTQVTLPEDLKTNGVSVIAQVLGKEGAGATIQSGERGFEQIFLKFPRQIYEKGYLEKVFLEFHWNSGVILVEVSPIGPTRSI